MIITNDHWLTGVVRDEIGGGSPMPVRRCAVIHYTAGATGRSSIGYWRQMNGEICAHVVIERSGEVIQCRPFDRVCFHAGISRWVDPKTGKLHKFVNRFSIGIELANAGDIAVSWARRQPGYESVQSKHRNGGGVREWEAFPRAQVEACAILCKALIARYKLDDITGHDCIAPERKSDPGPAFPFLELRESLGFSGMPAVHWPG